MLSENFIYRYHQIEESLKALNGAIKERKNNSPKGVYEGGISMLIDESLIEYRMILDYFKKLKHIRYYAKNAKTENYGTKSEYRTESLCEYIESLITHTNDMLNEMDHLGAISKVPTMTEENENE